MSETEYSNNQARLLGSGQHEQGALLWHLGMFFVVFGMIAFIVVSNRVYATLNSPQGPLSYIFGYGGSEQGDNAPAPEDSPDIYWKDYKIAHGQSLSAIFEHLRLDIKLLRDIMRASPVAKRLANIQPGNIIKFRYVNDRFAGLEYVMGPAESILVLRKNDRFTVNLIQQPYEKRTHYATATIESSLFQAAKHVGLSEKTTIELAEIFGWDIDFALDIQQGDRFSVVYQSLYYNDEKIKEGNILAAEFVNNGNVYRAVRYTDPDGNTGYFDPAGNNMKKPFLRTPVQFTRISSPFGRRHHPVLNKMRVHKGVDYAAPRGTPVKASGEGKILYQGKLRGYGNTVIIQHGKHYRTLYAHLQGYRKSQRMGAYVRQGQTIGYVGSSGLATGPHLHYEFQVDGMQRDPLGINLPQAKHIAKAYLPDFRLKASSILTLLTMVSESKIAANV